MSARGDAIGGGVAAAISVPEALALGAIAFGPLGADAAAAGALAGLLTLVAHNLASGLVPGVRPMSAGAHSLTSLMIAAAVESSGRTGDDALAAITGLSLAAGLLQIVFALVRVGSLVKYIPYPVVAGLVDGTAILIILRYLPSAFGLEDGAPRAGPALVGATVVVVSLAAIRRFPRVPGPLVGLAAGTAAFWAGRALGVDVGAVLDTRAGDAATTGVALGPLLHVLAEPGAWTSSAVELLPFAFGVAGVASLRTLIVTVAVDRALPPGPTASASRELLAQGIGNAFAALCGGVPAAGYVSPSLAAIQAGAGTRALRLWTALFAAMALAAAGPIGHTLPRTALAAMLVVFALRMFDPWTLRLFASSLRSLRDARYALGDLVTVVSVATILAFFGIFEAVGVGLVIALVSFVGRMSRPPLRRAYTAERVRSYVERPAREVAALESMGTRVAVFELQGALFFGGADHVATQVESALAAGARHVLLDLARVSDVDSTAAHVLARAARAAARTGARLGLSSVETDARIDATLAAAGVWLVADRHPSIDAALAASEDALLDESPLGTARYDHDASLDEIDALRFLQDRSAILPYVEDVAFTDGDPLFAMGDVGDSLSFLVRGRVTLEVDVRAGSTPPSPAPAHQVTSLEVRRRIAVLCPGTVLGELALLDGRTRAAHATALGRVRCLRLGVKRFDEMRRERPDLAAALMEGLAAELAKRVRIANRQATELRA